MQKTPHCAARHGGRLLIEPLCGAVKLSAVFTGLSDHRSLLRTAVPRLLDAPEGLISHNNLSTLALSRAIDFPRQTGKKIVGGEDVIAMSDPKETVEQVDGYQVPVNPMDDLECDSCQ